MASLDPAALLADLRAGRTSRNRDHERFDEPEARRVLRGYRRLKSLVRELLRPGVEAHLRRPSRAEGAAVEVVVRSVRYHRLVWLAPWELDFLRAELGAAGFLREPVHPMGPMGPMGPMR